MTIPRSGHTATLLPNGKVLVASGPSSELYDPTTGTWATTGSLTDRANYTATLLPNGKVLAAGGVHDDIVLTTTELYDPSTGTWTVTASLNAAREFHSATVLPNGKLLVAGGFTYSSGRLQSAELYDVGLGFRSAWQPRISKLKLTGDKRLSLKGSRFQGISQASGGNTQDSSTNYPIVQLRSIDSSHVIFIPVDPVRGWSDTTFRSIPVLDFSFGPALVTVFANGIPSEAKSVIISNTPAGDN